MTDHKKLRIGFIHPDLGIGGAERLVVDAAVAVQSRGADVTIFTTRHDTSRCFEETRDGTLKVAVLGSSLPQRLHPKVPVTILFSILKSLLLTFLLITSTWLPEPAAFFNPLSRLQPFDIFFVDQQSVCVPFLRFFLGTRVVFYCHFPDKLLSGGWEVSVDAKGAGQVQRGKTGLLKRVYRWPIDKLEEWTTGQSDVILANSQFSARVYARAFPSLAKRTPKVVYPCIDVSAYQGSKGKGKGRQDPGVALISSDRPTFISLNRFEAKKNAALAIHAFHKLTTARRVLDSHIPHGLRLVIAGGYDAALPDNINTLAALRQVADDLRLSHWTIDGDSSSPPTDVQILFILNFTTAQRTHLLTSTSTVALLYTPENEHFGIVPVEAMACGIPVIAADSGGPTESIIDLDFVVDPEHPSRLSIGNDAGTGLLRSPSAAAWSQAMSDLLSLSQEVRHRLARNGKARVNAHFSSETLGRQIEEACREALAKGDLHGQMGDTLIWGGIGLMGFAVVNLAIMVFFFGGKAS